MTVWHPRPPSTFAARNVGLLGGPSIRPMTATGISRWRRWPASACTKSGGWSRRRIRSNLTNGMMPLAERLASAAGMARHPAMRATALEAGLGTSYTVDTLERIQAKYPRNKFVWIMGADNLDPNTGMEGLVKNLSTRHSRCRIRPSVLFCPLRYPAWQHSVSSADGCPRTAPGGWCSAGHRPGPLSIAGCMPLRPAPFAPGWRLLRTKRRSRQKDKPASGGRDLPGVQRYGRPKHPLHNA